MDNAHEDVDVAVGSGAENGIRDEEEKAPKNQAPLRPESHIT
jgi:hypothetical protein